MSPLSGDFFYSTSEYACHIPFPNFQRLVNFLWTPTTNLESRFGLEPLSYYITPTPVGNGLQAENGLIRLPNITYSDTADIFLNFIGCTTLTLLGDCLVFSGANASSFHIIPLAPDSNGNSRIFSYNAKDSTGTVVPGDVNGGVHIYLGYPVFWNGKGSYQVYAKSLSETQFTKLDNTILPEADQVIVSATTFQDKLVVGTLQGNLLWSPSDWDGTTPWPTENSLTITLEPGEYIEFVREFRGGLVVCTRTTHSLSGRVLNIPTLELSGLRALITGRNSFFTKNGVVILDDKFYGLSPQGVLSVGYDSYSQTAFAQSESVTISELLIEIFDDPSVYSYISGFQDVRNKRAIYMYDFDLGGTRKSKGIVYQYDSKKWATIDTQLPIQKFFNYYGYNAAAGIIKDDSGNLYLGIWLLSDVKEDIPIKFVGSETISGTEYHYWNRGTSLEYKKTFTLGVMNMQTMGGNFVPGSTSVPTQLTIMVDDPINYKIYTRVYTGTSWRGNPEEVVEEYTENAETSLGELQQWSSNDSKAIWGSAYKNHRIPRRINVKTYETSSAYQIIFETESPGHIELIDISQSRGNKLQ